MVWDRNICFLPAKFLLLIHCTFGHKDNLNYVRGKCCIHPMSESSWTNIMYSGMDQLLIYISLGLLGTKPITCLAFASICDSIWNTIFSFASSICK